MIKNTIVRLLMTVIVCALPLWASAQERHAHPQVTAAGTVVDEAGEPVIGASVVDLASKRGVVTDLDGKFAIEVKKGTMLRITYTGFVAVDIKEGPALKVVMKEDDKLLQEVVVVGYGVQKKSSLTGAISSVKSEDMENRSITTVQEALGGKTAGVQLVTTGADPGSVGSIRIRGISSNASTEPLYVVDGVRQSDISGVDPNDIESMEVLKDAASAAIYGAEAGNGVVLITTKKGKKGQGRITYDFQYTIQKMSQKPKLLNAQQYQEYMLEGNILSEGTINNAWDGTTDSDWIDAIFENSYMQKHSLGFSGGGEKGNYYLSLGYLDNNGIIKGDNDTYQRLTATINSEYKVAKWLTVGTTNNIARTKRNNVVTNSGVSNLLISALMYDPLTPVIVSPDNLTPSMQTLQEQGMVLLANENGDYYGVSPLQTSCSGPLALINATDRRQSNFHVNGSIYANLSPFKGFVFTSRFGYKLWASDAKTAELPFYGYATSHREYLNFTSRNSNGVYYQWENFANYTKTWADAHTLTAMAGFSYQENKTSYSEGSLTANGEDALLGNTPRFYHLSYATDSSTKTVAGETLKTAKMSWFGRLGYEYKGRYMAQATLRADAADLSMLPKSNRWGYFPSVSAGWTISEERFFEPLKDVVRHLKVRASWGQNGSLASLGSYNYDSSIITYLSYPLSGGSTTAQTGNTGGGAPGGGPDSGPGGGPGGTTQATTTASTATTQGRYPNALGNMDLKWETSEQFDFGLDARLFGDRLSVSIDYFNKKTKDLLVTGISPSLSVGGTLSPINAGNVTNRGFEFELGWQHRVGDFRYSAKGNIATLTNKVTYIDPSLEFIPGTLKGNTALTAFQEGYPIYYFRGYKYTGVDAATGDPTFEDVNQNGMIDDGDVTCIGDAIPDFTYGITLSAEYKGLDLTIFGTGSYGNQIYMQLDDINSVGNKLKEVYYDDRWTPGNTTASRPSPACKYTDLYNKSSAMVFSGSYFKINQIQLGYALPKKLLHKISMNRARLYCSLDDFFIFTSYPGYGPDAAASAVEGVGVDFGAYPSSKKIVFGLNVEF